MMPELRPISRPESSAAGVFLYSRTIAALLLLASLVLAARVYGTAGFGYVSAIILINETATALGSIGLADAVMYFIGRAPARSAVIVRQATTLLSIAAIPVMVIVVATGAAMADDDLDLVPALPWLALVVLFELPTQPAVNQLLATGRARLASVVYAGFATLRMCAVLLPAATGWSLEIVPVVMAVFAFGRLVTHLAIVRALFPLRAGERWRRRSELRSMLAFALPVGISAMVGQINPQIDKYVVKLVLGLHDFAIYSVASWELPLVSLIPYAIAAVMQVRYVSLFAGQRRDELREFWHATSRKTMLAVIPLTILTIVVAEDLVTVVFGARYRAAATPFRIFTIALLQRVAAYGSMLQAIGQARVLVITSVSIVLTNLVLTVPFTWAIGANGAATATVVANLPAWFLSLHFIGSAWGAGIKDALPWRFYAAVVALAAATGAGVWCLLGVLSVSPGPRIALAVGIFLPVYTTLARACRLLDADDLAYVVRWFTFRLR